jgi:hypothetical protein
LTVEREIDTRLEMDIRLRLAPDGRSEKKEFYLSCSGLMPSGAHMAIAFREVRGRLFIVTLGCAPFAMISDFATLMQQPDCLSSTLH